MHQESYQKAVTTENVVATHSSLHFSSIHMQINYNVNCYTTNTLRDVTTKYKM